ncbi:MAG: hypothetical protein Q9218_002879 [Villophora microphyllina]
MPPSRTIPKERKQDGYQPYPVSEETSLERVKQLEERVKERAWHLEQFGPLERVPPTMREAATKAASALTHMTATLNEAKLAHASAPTPQKRKKNARNHKAATIKSQNAALKVFEKTNLPEDEATTALRQIVENEIETVFDGHEIVPRVIKEHERALPMPAMMTGALPSDVPSMLSLPQSQPNTIDTPMVDAGDEPIIPLNNPPPVFEKTLSSASTQAKRVPMAVINLLNNPPPVFDKTLSSASTPADSTSIPSTSLPWVIESRSVAYQERLLWNRCLRCAMNETRCTGDSGFACSPCLANPVADCIFPISRTVPVWVKRFFLKFWLTIPMQGALKMYHVSAEPPSVQRFDPFMVSEETRHAYIDLADHEAYNHCCREVDRLKTGTSQDEVEMVCSVQLAKSAVSALGPHVGSRFTHLTRAKAPILTLIQKAMSTTTKSDLKEVCAVYMLHWTTGYTTDGYEWTRLLFSHNLFISPRTKLMLPPGNAHELALKYHGELFDPDLRKYFDLVYHNTRLKYQQTTSPNSTSIRIPAPFFLRIPALSDVSFMLHPRSSKRPLYEQTKTVLVFSRFSQEKDKEKPKVMLDRNKALYELALAAFPLQQQPKVHFMHFTAKATEFPIIMGKWQTPVPKGEVFRMLERVHEDTPTNSTMTFLLRGFDGFSLDLAGWCAFSRIWAMRWPTVDICFLIAEQETKLTRAASIRGVQLSSSWRWSPKRPGVWKFGVFSLRELLEGFLLGTDDDDIRLLLSMYAAGWRHRKLSGPGSAEDEWSTRPGRNDPVEL